MARATKCEECVSYDYDEETDTYYCSMLTAYSEREFVEQAKITGVSGYLVKPIDEKSLIPSIEMAVARNREMRRLRKDIASVSERLESRSLIEKAKGFVMKRPLCVRSSVCVPSTSLICGWRRWASPKTES